MSEEQKNKRGLEGWEKIILWALVLMFVLFIIELFDNTYLFYGKAKAQSLYEYEQGSEDFFCDIYDRNLAYMTQTLPAHDKDYYLQQVDLRLRRNGVFATTTDVILAVYDNPFGSNLLGSTTTPAQNLGVAFATTTFDFSEQNILIPNGFPQEMLYLSVHPNEFPSRIYARIKRGHADPDLTGYCKTRPALNLDAKFYLQGVQLNPEWWSFGIPVAYATTSCTYVVSGNTTTAECSDPLITTRIPMQDTFYGILLFLLTIAGTLIGLEYMNNRDKRFKD